jgi:phosphoglycerate dehydrogenase-like enzyme
MMILFLPYPDPDHPSRGEFISAVDGNFPVEFYDPELPLEEQMTGVDVVVDTGGAVGTPEMVDAAQAAGVKLWQATTNGLDHVPYLDRLLETGISVAHSPGPLSAVPVAEHALSMILCFAKNLHLPRTRQWRRSTSLELAGQVLGLIGFGAAARELARRAGALGMRIMAIDVEDVPREVREALNVEFFADPLRMDKVLAEADFLVPLVPLTSTTRHMIDRRALGLMKATAVLINVARGEIVEESALIEVLECGGIKGAGLDVFASEPLDPDHPLLRMGNVLTTRRRAEAAVENVRRLAHGLPLMYLVSRIE